MEKRRKWKGIMLDPGLTPLYSFEPIFQPLNGLCMGRPTHHIYIFFLLKEGLLRYETMRFLKQISRRKSKCYFPATSPPPACRILDLKETASLGCTANTPQTTFWLQSNHALEISHDAMSHNWTYKVGYYGNRGIFSEVERNFRWWASLIYGSYAWIKLGKVQDCGEVPRKVPGIFS